MKAIMCVILALVAIGCSKDQKCIVTSNTSWSGAFGNRTVDGRGNMTVDLSDDGMQCVVVQKNTDTGSLSIKLSATGGGPLNPDETKGPVTTTAEYGVVSDCIGD